MRILGLDVGEKRIGVSISDEMLFTAQSLKTIQRCEIKSDIHDIKQIVDEYSVSEIVIGMPYNMNGSMGFKAEEVERFKEQVQKYINIPIIYVDERMTTAEAHRSMLEGDLSRKKRKQRVDAIAAQLILQIYLDIKRIQKENEEH